MNIISARHSSKLLVTSQILLKICVAILKVMELVCWLQTGEDGGEDAVGNQGNSTDQNMGKQMRSADDCHEDDMLPNKNK